VAADTRHNEAEPRLIDVRAASGELVRRATLQQALAVVEAGLGEAIGVTRIKYVRLRAGADIQTSSKSSLQTWAREQRQDSRVRHTKACKRYCTALRNS
jgi:hypothetical protein